MFTYTASIILAVVAVAVIILQSYENAYAAVYSFGIWLASFAILGFLFIPKVKTFISVYLLLIFIYCLDGVTIQRP